MNYINTTRVHEREALDAEIRAINLRRTADAVAAAPDCGLSTLLRGLLVRSLRYTGYWSCEVSIDDIAARHEYGHGPTIGAALSDAIRRLAAAFDSEALKSRAAAAQSIGMLRSTSMDCDEMMPCEAVS